MNDNGGYLPTVEDLLTLRASGTQFEMDIFESVWDKLVPAVSPLWSQKKHKLLMSQAFNEDIVVSVTDEAYALLAIENYRPFRSSMEEAS